MPAAADQLRRRWRGPDSYFAQTFLVSHGYILLRTHEWRPPANHEPTEEELSAIEFLVREWDFGGLEGPETVHKTDRNRQREPDTEAPPKAKRRYVKFCKEREAKIGQVIWCVKCGLPDIHPVHSQVNETDFHFGEFD